MRFNCQCGFQFNDSGDCVAYKARILADQDVNELAEMLEFGEEPHRDELELCMPALDLIERTVFQCPQCGRLYVEDADYSYIQFVPCEDAEPSPEVNKNLLRSAHGERWRGYLYGVWNNPKPEHSEHKGYIEPLVNMEFDNLEFDDFTAFEKRYYELFDELEEKDRLERAVLWVNDVRKHEWDRD